MVGFSEFPPMVYISRCTTCNTVDPTLCYYPRQDTKTVCEHCAFRQRVTCGKERRRYWRRHPLRALFWKLY